MTISVRNCTPRRPERDLHELFGLAGNASRFAEDFVLDEIARRGDLADPSRPGVCWEPEVAHCKWMRCDWGYGDPVKDPTWSADDLRCR